MATAIALPSPCFRLSSLSTSFCYRARSQTREARRSTRFLRLVLNGAPASSANIDAKIYRRLDSCLVIPPPTGQKPRAIIKFLGGGFVGATPEVTYGHLMELLAKEGFLIVSVPYNVTFDHAEATRQVFERFHYCMEVLFNNGLPEANLSASDIISVPLYSVGHSNGALLQLLVGSYYSEKIPEANAVVSFNNKSASEAVPYFEQLGPVVSQVMPIMEANPMYSMARNASGDAWNALLDAAGTLIQDYDHEAMTSLTEFVDQLPSVFNQVTQGTSEFKPTPAENREFFNNSYSVPRTLLDLKRRAGYHYTPADAVAQGLKALSLNDTRVLARTIADWFKGLGRR